MAPAALLFLLSFFSFLSLVFVVAEAGVTGHFSAPFVDFLTGAGKSSVFSCGVGTSFGGGAGVPTLGGCSCEDLLVDMEEVNEES